MLSTTPIATPIDMYRANRASNAPAPKPLDYLNSNKAPDAPWWLFVVMGALLYVLPITTIVYGFADEDDDCQRDTPVSTTIAFQLNVWVKVTGIYRLITATVILLSLFHTNAFVHAILGLMDYLFSFSWFVVGVVMLSVNDNNLCIADQKPLGQITIANLVLWWWHVPFWIFVRTFKTDT